jgi:hypothetical protein
MYKALNSLGRGKTAVAIEQKLIQSEANIGQTLRVNCFGTKCPCRFSRQRSVRVTDQARGLPGQSRPDKHVPVNVVRQPRPDKVRPGGRCLTASSRQKLLQRLRPGKLFLTGAIPASFSTAYGKANINNS